MKAFYFRIACSAGVFFERAICSRKRHVETSRTEEEMYFFLPSPPPFHSFALAPTVRVTISTLPNQFHRRKIKDGGYNNITNTNKVSPAKNTPALQAIFFRMIILLILITWISEFKPLQTEATFIVGCYKLQPFAHPIACCFALLAFAAQSMKWSNFWVNNS